MLINFDTMIWEMVQHSVITHMHRDVQDKLGITYFRQLEPDMRTVDLFPKSHPESRNRLGQVLFDLHRFFREHIELDIQITYPKRSEYFVFPTLESIWEYLYCYIQTENIL